MQKSITNIVICYANEDEVIEYAKELSKQTVRVKLVIVLNKIGEKGTKYLETELDKLTIDYSIYDPGENLGYLNGLIYGYSKSDKAGDWFILSNTDIKIYDCEMFEKFFNSISFVDSDIWLLGPSVFAPKQSKYSNPYLRIRPNKMFYKKRILAMRFATIYNWLFMLKNRKRTLDINVNKNQSAITYAIHGSYMFIRKELLEVLECRPAWELLYNEEQYIAELVRLNGKKVFYDSNLEINHMEGASTRKVNVKNRYNLMISANKRILKEFYCE